MMKKKIRPCAFGCIQNQTNEILYLLLICSVKNEDNLGTKIMEQIILYAKNNGHLKITLECDEKNISFYEKFGFVNEGIINNDMNYMIKKIN